jgi:hypothetical protein
VVATVPKRAESEQGSCYRRVVRRAGLLVGVLTVLLLGCSGSSSPQLSNDFGGCAFGAHARCPNADLAALSVPQSDLRGADFSGANFKGTDLSDSDLRDANLSGANLSRVNLVNADLRGADLSDAILFQATLDGARWSGANRTGTRYCETVLPDGSFSDCKELDVPTTIDTRPPAVVSFGPDRPVRCLHDFIGEGINVDWRVRHASSVAFQIDGVQAATAVGDKGVKRIPFPCDGARHTVTLQAFASFAPVASDSFELSLEP